MLSPQWQGSQVANFIATIVIRDMRRGGSITANSTAAHAGGMNAGKMNPLPFALSAGNFVEIRFARRNMQQHATGVGTAVTVIEFSRPNKSLRINIDVVTMSARVVKNRLIPVISAIVHGRI
jgi:hypothetical protein